MIPKQINRKHILSAIKEINTQTPVKIRKHYVLFNGERYSPKQLISQAHKYIDGQILSPKLFNGGQEANQFLQKLGFNTLSIGLPIRIGTILIQQNHKQTNKQRLVFLKQIINELPSNIEILLLPGGFFSTNKKSNKLYSWVEREVSEILIKIDLIVVLGIDGRYQKDQIAISINKNGIIAMGRKFYGVKFLEDYIEKANHYLEGENNYPRIFEYKGKRFYLAICFDSYGVRHLELDNPNIDCILNLIHEFHPKGEKRSGDSYFAKYGVAGSSRQWECPTIGSTVFCNRQIPENWPCGVVYKKTTRTLQRWQYKHNKLNSVNQFYINGQTELALIKVFLV